MSTSSWHPCAICGVPTQAAVCGNRLLFHRDVQGLPTEQAPGYHWRCQDHQHYQMHTASAVRASELGDLIYTLTCGHEVSWVGRGPWAATPALVERRIATRQIRLDQPQRCYICGDLEQKGNARP